MRHSLHVVLGVALFAAGAQPVLAASEQQQVTYTQLVAGANSLGMTLTNYGFFGNNFTSRAASFEFPLGSGYEHMPRAGLWFGAMSPDSGFTSEIASASCRERV